jgi:hypothetical protein
MTHSTSGRTPPSRPRDGQVRLEQERRAPSREGNLSQDGKPTEQVSPEFANLLAEQKTHSIMEPDNVGLEQLIAVLTRIPIRRPH